MESTPLAHGSAWYPAGQPLPRQNLLDLTLDFDAIPLWEASDARTLLLSRVESKHLMTSRQCTRLLAVLADSCSVLEVGGFRTGAYETVYLDDQSFSTYMQHHNGKANRYKLRFRHYETSGDTFLEVKKKTNRGTTEKKRMRTEPSPTGFLPEQIAFLREEFPLDFSSFRPVLATRYERFTLVSKDTPERITFDCGISFSAGNKSVCFPGLVIAEVKYERGTKAPRALRALHSQGIGKRSFSKYCIGVALLYPGIKSNRFKETLLFLFRLSQGGAVAW